MRLIQSVEYELETDFALLSALQPGVSEAPVSMTFATSAPGAIAMTCGTRYANLHVRLERWDERPSPPADRWEDIDELPWVSHPDGGPVVAAGFDPAEDHAGLTVNDLPRARVQVLAKGRHRYAYGDGVPDHLPREAWLLRWWPDETGADAVAGAPRRLAGPPPFWYPMDGWRAALHAWAQTGWHAQLLAVPAFRAIEMSLLRAGHPCSADELAACWGPRGPERDEHGPYTLNTSVLGHPPKRDPPDLSIKRERDLLQGLAAAAGMRSIETFGDALRALRQLNLLLVTEGEAPERYVPNPSPPAVWDVMELTPESRHGLITQALYADYKPYQADIQHLLRWARDGRLDVTPLTLAVRLGLPVNVVLGTLRLLQHLGDISIQSATESLEADSEITVHAHTRLERDD